MMKRLVLLMLIVIAVGAHAAPFTTSKDPVASNWSGPTQVLQSLDDGVTWGSTGCAWKVAGATKTWTCDQAGSDTSPGTRKLRYKYLYVAACDPGGLGPCIPGGESVDVPFSLTWLPLPAPSGLQVVPSVAP